MTLARLHPLSEGKNSVLKVVPGSYLVRFYSDGNGTNMVRLWYDHGTTRVGQWHGYGE